MQIAKPNVASVVIISDPFLIFLSNIGNVVLVAGAISSFLFAAASVSFAATFAAK